MYQTRVLCICLYLQQGGLLDTRFRLPLPSNQCIDRSIDRVLLGVFWWINMDNESKPKGGLNRPSHRQNKPSINPRRGRRLASHRHHLQAAPEMEMEGGGTRGGGQEKGAQAGKTSGSSSTSGGSSAVEQWMEVATIGAWDWC